MTDKADFMDNANVNRRQLLAGMGVTGAALAAKPVLAAPAILKGLPDVVVVGAGAWGGWSALTLREQGAKVTLVDTYGAGNARGSSAGESRNIRLAYGDREIYSRWADRAWQLWHARQDEFGRRLIFESGALSILSRKDRDIQAAVFNRLKLPYENLTAEEARRRWPQASFADNELLFFEPRAGAVKARETLIAVNEAFERKGGRNVIGLARLGETAGGRLSNIVVNDESLSAGSYVFAAGPWLPRLLPELLGGKIATPRAELFFVGSAPGDLRYRWDRIPNITEAGVGYTTSDIGSGLKVRLLQPNINVDPDKSDRFPTRAIADDVISWVSRRLPGLVGQPLTLTQVCQVEMSDNEHYIVDRHPGQENVWIAGGGSAHSFKMGPMIGEYIADRIAGKPAPVEYESVFRLAAHGLVQNAAKRFTQAGNSEVVA